MYQWLPLIASDQVCVLGGEGIMKGALTISHGNHLRQSARLKHGRDNNDVACSVDQVRQGLVEGKVEGGILALQVRTAQNNSQVARRKQSAEFPTDQSHHGTCRSAHLKA